MTNFSTIASFPFKLKQLLFSGKIKLVTISILVIISLALFPFTIGGLLGYAAYRYIPHKLLRNVTITVIAIPTLFVGSAWVAAFFSETSAPATNKVVSQQPSFIPTPEIKKDAPSESPQASVEAEVVSVLQVDNDETDSGLPVDIPSPSLVAIPATQSTESGVLVRRVVDGDTIELETGEVVRYIGIDTPETVHPSKAVQCFGKEASTKNKSLVEGKRVRLEKDVSNTDKYGRLLRYVYIGDTFVNDFLVRQGYAYASSYPPDVKYQSQFRQAEQEARTNKRGLWASCPPTTSVPNTSTPVTQPTATTSTSGTYTGGDKDCSDFKTQDEAQAFYISQGGPAKDPHKLDQDKDGIACETLP